jgi:hypothetical protein
MYVISATSSGLTQWTFESASGPAKRCFRGGALASGIVLIAKGAKSLVEHSEGLDRHATASLTGPWSRSSRAIASAYDFYGAGFFGEGCANDGVQYRACKLRFRLNGPRSYSRRSRPDRFRCLGSYR